MVLKSQVRNELTTVVEPVYNGPVLFLYLTLLYYLLLNFSLFPHCATDDG